MLHKKISTATYVIQYGEHDPEYAGFANDTRKEIFKKLHRISNKSITKTYYMEGEILIRDLFLTEMIVPMRKNGVYRIFGSALKN